MLCQSEESISKFWSRKEKTDKEIRVEFEQETHYNALISENWCPLSIRLQVAREPAKKREIAVFCETEKEALDIAKHHFCLTGSNFQIKNAA